MACGSGELQVGFFWRWLKKYPGILGRKRNCCPDPTAFLPECSGAQEALPVSSHFIIAFPGQMGPSLAFSGDGCEVEVAGPGAAPALWHAAEAGSWQGESQGEGPTPPYPCPSASAASSKLLQMGVGISFSSSSSLSLAGAATQSPCSRCHLLGCSCTWHSNILILL